MALGIRLVSDSGALVFLGDQLVATVTSALAEGEWLLFDVEGNEHAVVLPGFFRQLLEWGNRVL